MKKYSGVLDVINKLSFLLIGIITLCLVIVGVQYLSSPEHIRSPSTEHYHFRMQIIHNDSLINFAEEKYQEDYAAGQCTAELTDTPIHFHDNINQLTHIHWNGVRGGDVLKYYGWNLVGDSDHQLGKRFDEFPWGSTVPVKGQLLPNYSDGDKFYVYTGEENNFERRVLNDFLNQDLEVFFGTESLLKEGDDLLSNLKNLVIQKTYAHSEGHLSEENEDLENQRLTRINNLIGNVIIFVQDEEPTDDHVNEQFSLLTPLQDSTCGG